MPTHATSLRLAALVGLSLAAVAASAAPPRVELLATGEVASWARDRSGLIKPIDTPAGRMWLDQLGSFGSGIAYTGQGNTYIACDDRGPSDGAVAFPCRVQVLNISVEQARDARWSMHITCDATHLLRTTRGEPFIGASSAFNPANPAASLRLDPEGIRVLPDGSLLISDEYGPWLDRFAPDGQHLQRLAPPPYFRNAGEGASIEGELPPRSTTGRQPNRGMEGLAVTPEGLRAFGIMQSPLLQDAALDAANKRTGTCARIIEYSLRPGAEGPRRQFVYRMDHPSFSLNEICAVSDRTFLVIERDGKAGDDARFRSIVKVVIDGATDVSELDHLDPAQVGHAIQPVRKQPLIDLMDPAFGLAGSTMPEKIEGLTFGPRLKDGRLLLLVATDNDMIEGNPTLIWAFAIDPMLLPDYAPPLTWDQHGLGERAGR